MSEITDVNVKWIRKEIIYQLKFDKNWRGINNSRDRPDSQYMMFYNEYFSFYLKKETGEIIISLDQIHNMMNIIYMRELNIPKIYYIFLKTFYTNRTIRRNKKLDKLNSPQQIANIQEITSLFFDRNKRLLRKYKINEILK